MSVWRYTGSGGGTTGHDTQFMALCGDLMVKVGTFVLNDTTGLQSITGVGFQPECVILCGASSDLGASKDGGGLFVGAATPGDQFCAAYADDNFDPVSVHGRYSAFRDDKVITGVLSDTVAGVPITFEAELDSFDSDGFTIDITDAPADNSAVGYVCLAGEADYAVGTFQSATATGLQAITGLGFEPKAIMLVSAQTTALGVSSDARFCGGVADGFGHQYAHWDGSADGDVQLASRVVDDGCLLFAWDAGSGPGSVVLGEAALDSLDADGFTLDWLTNDGTARYVGYVAFRCDQAAGGQFDWVISSHEVVDIPDADLKPRLVFGFTNGLTVVNTVGAGANIGFSASDDSLNQWYATATAISNPQFGFPNSRSTLNDGSGFNTYAVMAGLTPVFSTRRGCALTSTTESLNRHLLPILGVGT